MLLGSFNQYGVVIVQHLALSCIASTRLIFYLHHLAVFSYRSFSKTLNSDTLLQCRNRKDLLQQLLLRHLVTMALRSQIGSSAMHRSTELCSSRPSSSFAAPHFRSHTTMRSATVMESPRIGSSRRTACAGMKVGMFDSENITRFAFAKASQLCVPVLKSVVFFTEDGRGWGRYDKGRHLLLLSR